MQCKRSDCSDVSRKNFWWTNPFHPTNPSPIVQWVHGAIHMLVLGDQHSPCAQLQEIKPQKPRLTGSKQPGGWKIVFLASKWQKWWQYLLLVHWQQLRQDSKYPHHSGPGRSACKIRHLCEKIGCRIILSFNLEWLDVSIVVSCSVAQDLRTQVDELKDSCPAFILPRLEQSETAIDLTCPGYRVGRTTPRFTAGLMLRCFSEDMTQTWKSKRRRRSLPRYQWYMPLAGVMSCQDQLRQFFNSAK